MEVLVVVDMQNDFINGSLKNEEAEKIIPSIAKFVEDFKGKIIFTRDTHNEDYMETTEGHYLPVKHCIKGTFGHQIHRELLGIRDIKVIDKRNFGSDDLIYALSDIFNTNDDNNTVHLVGTCTDICVVTNALLIKTFLPNVKVIVHKDMCAGVTKEAHESALTVMKNCQCEIV